MSSCEPITLNLSVYTWGFQETELQPNSCVWLSCPEVSRLQRHPFTLGLVHNSPDSSTPARATIYLKPIGSWAQVHHQSIRVAVQQALGT